MTAVKIREAALRFFALKGYEGTSLAEIAAEVGIKKPSLYAHYDSKYQMFLAVINSETEAYHQFRSSVLADSAGLDYEQRLYTIFRSVIMYFLKDRIRLSFWVRVWLFPPSETRQDNLMVKQQQLNRQFVRQITNIFQQGMDEGIIRDGPAEEMAYAYLCLLDGCLMRATCYNDVDYEQHMFHIWNCFWSGFKVRREG